MVLECAVLLVVITLTRMVPSASAQPAPLQGSSSPNQWTWVNSDESNTPVNRFFHAATVWGSAMVVSGGVTFGAVLGINVSDQQEMHQVCHAASISYNGRFRLLL